MIYSGNYFIRSIKRTTAAQGLPWPTIDEMVCGYDSIVCYMAVPIIQLDIFVKYFSVRMLEYMLENNLELRSILIRQGAIVNNIQLLDYLYKYYDSDCYREMYHYCIIEGAAMSNNYDLFNKYKSYYDNATPIGIMSLNYIIKSTNMQMIQEIINIFRIACIYRLREIPINRALKIIEFLPNNDRAFGYCTINEFDMFIEWWDGNYNVRLLREAVKHKDCKIFDHIFNGNFTYQIINFICRSNNIILIKRYIHKMDLQYINIIGGIESLEVLNDHFNFNQTKLDKITTFNCEKTISQWLLDHGASPEKILDNYNTISRFEWILSLQIIDKEYVLSKEYSNLKQKYFVEKYYGCC